MPDKYADMSLDRLVEATLLLLEYEKDIYNPEWYRKGDSGWLSRTALSGQEKHAFAAEVKQWMMDQRDEDGDRKWHYGESWDDGLFVEFWRYDGFTPAQATYDNMDEHPVAVCRAALRAKETEKAV